MTEVELEDGALIAAPPAPPGPPLALYRRYRPDTFADVIGQEHVTEPLQRALVNNRVNHAYLFSGPRGCGKTTSARILARALNCEFGPRAEPCGECQSCRDLATGGPGSIDVIEIDAASHGGVDDARDLRERAFFAPVASRYKIYIVDEAHMVTTAGFNALLKLVEEPPPHVKFIFATTEPDKVIGTIRSRTHHYPFRLVPPRVLSAYLAKLCDAEGIAVDAGVLPLVVRAGAGSVRDSLSVLDQLLGGASEDGVSYSHAAALLGYTPDSLLDEMLDAFAAGDSRGVFSCVDKVIEVGQDPRRFAEDLLRRLRDLVIVAAVPDALTSGLVDVAADQADRLSNQAASLGPGELTRAAEVIAAGLTEMRGTTAPRLHLELMCARVLLPATDVDERGVHARLDRLERRIGVSGTLQVDAGGAATVTSAGAPPPRPSLTPAVPPAAAPDGERTGSAAPTRPAASAEPSAADAVGSPRAAPSGATDSTGSTDPTDRAGQADQADDQGSTTNAGDEPGPPPSARRPATSPADSPARVAGEADRRRTTDGTAPAPAAPPNPENAVPARPQLSITDVRRLWPEVLEEVKGRRRFTWILLSQNAHVADVREKVLVLAMPNAGARENFSRGGSEDILREALIVVLGADLKIETMIDPSASGAKPAAGSRPGPGSGPMEPDAPAAGDGDWPEPVRLGGPPASSSPAEADQPPPDRSSGDHGSGGAPPQARPGPERDAHAPTRSGAQPDAGSNTQPGVASGARPDFLAPAATADPSRDKRGRAAESEPDEGAERDDTDLDESGESGTQLLARHLGAEIIAEEETGA